MNTKQLVAFWFTGIAIIVVLVGFAIEKPDYALWLILAAIIILGALFIYSFASHPEANKKIVAASVSIPIVLLTAILLIIANVNFSEQGAYSTKSGESRSVTPNDIELFDTKLFHSSGTFGQTTLRGRAKNLSSVPISSISLRVNIYENGELIDGSDVFISFRYNEIPPQGVQSFEEEVYNLALPEEWSWNYTIQRIFPKN